MQRRFYHCLCLSRTPGMSVDTSISLSLLIQDSSGPYWAFLLAPDRCKPVLLLKGYEPRRLGANRTSYTTIETSYIDLRPQEHLPSVPERVSDLFSSSFCGSCLGFCTNQLVASQEASTIGQQPAIRSVEFFVELLRSTRVIIIGC